MATHTIRPLSTEEISELLLGAQERMHMFVQLRDEIGENQFHRSFPDQMLNLATAITALHSAHVRDAKVEAVQ